MHCGIDFQARLNIENLLRAPCKFPVFSTLNLEIVSKYCNLHGARGLNTGISQRIFGRNFRNSELNLEIGSKSEPKCSRFSALNLEVGSDEILN